jgi:glycosyltransferase involved in cell wall biosynthesis
MKKIVFVDLNFCWPPDGGGPIHMHWIIEGYAKTHDVTLFIPRIASVTRLLGRLWPLSATKFFLRGSISSDFKPSYKIVVKDYTMLDFLPKNLMKVVNSEVEKLKPDHVFIGDGWFLKPYICLALKKWKPIMRLISHEMLCIKGHGMLFRNNKVCEINYLDIAKINERTCMTCSSRFLISYPSPRWIFEYLVSGAFKSSYKKICQSAFESLDRIHVGNQYVKNRLKDFVSRPIDVIPNFVDQKRFESTPKIKKQFTFLLIGRLNDSTKGLKVAFDALEDCWEIRQDYVVNVAGDSNEKKSSYIRYLGWKPYAQVHEVYKDVDLLIVPSLSPDVHPNVIFEAMASGVAVMGSKVGGIPEQIENNVTGMLFDPGNVKELSEKLLWAMDHQDEIRKMGEQGRIQVEQKFNFEKVFEKYYKHAFELSNRP